MARETSSTTALSVVLTVMGVAIGAGGWVVLLYGALTAISEDVIDAARIDGASAWQLVRHIKLPLLRSYIAFILIISFAAGFQVFVEPTVLAAGAPGRVSTSWSLNQIVYTYATSQANYGRASVLALCLLVVCAFVALVVIKKTNFYSIDARS